MQSDEVIWNVIGKGHCSYKASYEGVVLCRNPYNVTGLCSKTTCPLANGYYGTVLEEDGICYLHLKTVERAHTPRFMWEKVRLSDNLTKAFEQIDKHMLNVYKDWQITRVKKRLCKIREYLKRMHKIAAAPKKVYDYEPNRVRRREAKREVVALRAAKLQTSVEQELVARLKAGHYGDIYNYSSSAFQTLLDEEDDEEEEDDELLDDDEPDIEEVME